MFKIFKNAALLAICFSFLSIYSYGALTYRMVDLGLQESDQSEAVAVNDKGQIAGFYWILGKKYYFIWDASKGITILDFPVTVNIVVLNNAEQIAGNYGNNRSFFWDPVSGFLDIGTLGGEYTTVYDMNDLGQIVGCSETNNASLVNGMKEKHGYMWQLGQMVDLGTLSGELGLCGDESSAIGINNQCVIIGSSNSALIHKGKVLSSKQRAVTWENGIIKEFDPYCKDQIILQGINNTGLVTFYSSPPSTVFVYDFSNKIGLPFYNFSTKINDKGNILFSNCLLLRSNNYGVSNCVHFHDYFLSEDWQGEVTAKDFNNHNCVVGSAINSYNERHAIMLEPINKE